MAEKDQIFNSKIKYDGILSFRDFYKFCYDWLAEEEGFDVAEEKYKEKLAGNEKGIEIEWTATKKVTDYFKLEIKVKFKIDRLTDVEINQNGVKIKMNKGGVETAVKGTLIRDYDGKFEQNSFMKFLRGIYEKWVIASRVEQFENKLIGICNEFLNQSKAYLDLEGKR
jgi:hypothetical protein